MRCARLWNLALAASTVFATPATAAADAMAQMQGTRIELPHRVAGRIEASSCLELRVLETGIDVTLQFTAEGADARQGADADVARHGLQVLVECADAPLPFVADITAIGATSPATALIMQRVWTAADGEAYLALRDFAAATAQYRVANAAANVATKLADAARRFDAIGDAEHAAIAWMLATGRAEAALDRTLASSAFDAADARLKPLNWTRYRVVLLNNRAWFVAPIAPREGQRRIDEAFALQATLADAKLAATVENNVCLLRYQYGALGQAEACFARVLDQHLALKNGDAAIGATRNNVALVHLAQGRYRNAEAEFRVAAAQRLAGGDKQGHIVSLCNIALSLYQLGAPEAALQQLQEAYATAAANADSLGRAHAASIIAAIYLAWGDSDTALTYANEAEQVFRKAGRIANLAPTLRLLARISLDRGDRDAALTTVRDAWQLAVDNELRLPAANIASVYAQVLIERGDLDEAERFIADARARLATYFGAADLAALGIVELRLLRERGRLDAARQRADTLAKRLVHPGFARSRLLIERQLIDDADGTRATPTLRKSYAALLAQLRRSLVVAPDPELALRLQELARPAAEAAIARELAACTDADTCAALSLRRALEFFALEPRFAPPGASGTDELPALRQALSQLQSRDDMTVSSAELIATIKRRQIVARRQRSTFDTEECAICRQVDSGSGDLVYFFGVTRGWRWQRVGAGWRVVELPRWETLATALRAIGDPPSRYQALRQLMPLVAALAPIERDTLVVRGDSRLLRVPFGALPLDDQTVVIDRYAVAFAAGTVSTDTDAQTVAFAAGDEDGEDALPMVEGERRAFAEWAQHKGLTLVDAQSTPLALLHVAAHGQGNLGAGMSVLWVKNYPLLSYLSPGTRVANTVVINGCDSGAAPEHGLAQASIAAAFLRNGARRVVATLYPVRDLAGANFSRAFYAQYDPSRGNVAAAVRHAQQELRRIPNQDDSWAAYFTVVAGDDSAVR